MRRPAAGGTYRVLDLDGDFDFEIDADLKVKTEKRSKPAKRSLRL